MCKELTGWEKAVEFHGHVCPGLAIGYRAAGIALDLLQEERAADEELVAVVENDACGVDGVQVVTGCTLGKGNLVFRDLGKQVFTFLLRGGAPGVRVALKYGAMENEERSALRAKVFGNTAAPDERERFNRLQEQAVEALLNAPAGEYFLVRRVKDRAPEKARLHPSLQCAYCGEGVMEPRARLREGAACCLDCADRYRSRISSGVKPDRDHKA